MPVFKYIGYDKAGAETNGIIEADGQKDAALKVKSKGIFPKEITEDAAGKKRVIFKKAPPLILPVITRSLSTLLSSGVPLIDSIASISAEQKGDWRNMLTEIRESLAGGSSLARAMQTYPSIFPSFYTGMVEAGENSGKLTDVLLKLAEYLESETSIKNRVKTALIYPAFMTCISILIILFLFTFVIPKITSIFEGTSATLPFITIVLIWISDILKSFWWLLLGIIAGASFLFRKLKETKKELIDSILLRDPSGILMGLYMLRFSMTMGFLLSGGLPILYAMQLTSKATGNVVLENRIMAAQNLVSQGAKLSTSLEGFPPTLLQVITTGEQTGTLPEVLKRTADFYEAEFDRKLQRAIGLLEPSIILLMGMVVLFIVLAVLLPIFDLNQMMQ